MLMITFEYSIRLVESGWLYWFVVVMQVGVEALGWKKRGEEWWTFLRRSMSDQYVWAKREYIEEPGCNRGSINVDFDKGGWVVSLIWCWRGVYQEDLMRKAKFGVTRFLFLHFFSVDEIRDGKSWYWGVHNENVMICVWSGGWWIAKKSDFLCNAPQIWYHHVNAWLVPPSKSDALYHSQYLVLFCTFLCNFSHFSCFKFFSFHTFSHFWTHIAYAPISSNLLPPLLQLYAHHILLNHLVTSP